MVLDKSLFLGIVMTDMIWELSVINLIAINVFTGLPYTILFDHHFSRFIPKQKFYLNALTKIISF